jgi:WD40 repeat protein
MKHLRLIILVVFLLNIGMIQAQFDRPLGPGKLYWSLDGSKIVGVGVNFLQLWDGNSGALLADLSFAFPSNNTTFNTIVGAASWNPDSIHFATASGDGILRIWDASDPAQVTLNYQSSQPVFDMVSVAWHPNGEILAIGTYGGGVNLWDVSTQSYTTFLNLGLIEEFAWRPKLDEFTLAYSDSIEGAGVITLNPTTDFILSTQEAGVRTFAWSHNGSLLAIGYNNGIIMLWDAVNQVEYARLQGVSNSDFSSLVFNSDDTILISSQGEDATLWSVASGQQIGAYEPIFGVIATSPIDPDRIVFGYWETYQIDFASISAMISD